MHFKKYIIFLQRDEEKKHIIALLSMKNVSKELTGKIFKGSFLRKKSEE